VNAAEALAVACRVYAEQAADKLSHVSTKDEILSAELHGDRALLP